MPRPHDRGGFAGQGPIDRSERKLALWEKQLIGTLKALDLPANGDEFRRAIEDIEALEYERLGYFERWVVALEAILVQKGVLTREELDAKATAPEANTGT